MAVLPAVSSRAAEGSAPAEDEFPVWEYRVLGNTVLPRADIERLIYPNLGEHKTLQDVESVRKGLEALYRDSGYGTVYVDIPEQTVDGGIVRLRITEGRLDRVRITGARYFANGKIREELPALQPGAVLDLPDLQAQLGQVNQRSRDRAVTPVLKAGRSPGMVDVELKVQDSPPLHASVEVNDRYSANTTRTRASLNASYENLFQRYHSLSLQYQGSPEALDETRVLAATYVARLPESGNVLAFYAVDTSSDFAVVDSGLSVLGAGRIYGARYIVNLPGEPGYFHSVTLGSDFKDFSDDIRLGSGANDTTPITYMAWSATYGGNVITRHTSTGFNFGANLGLRGVVNDPADFEFKRFRSKPNFFALRADANHERPLLAGSTVYVRVAGQWTGDPLISNEQFGIGGVDSVRGYLESEQLGDLGLSGSLELRSPSLHGYLGAGARTLVAYAFYDAGVASILKFIESTEIDGEITSIVRDSKTYELAGYGGGLRFSGYGLDAAVNWGYPLRASPNVAKGDSRIHFQLRYGF